MALILIENGCKYLGEFQWEYEIENSEGIFYYFFSSLQPPKIGDSIDTDTFTLVPLVGYIINNDPGMQKPCEDEGAWPSRIRAQ